MSFIDTLFSNLARYPHRAFVTEVHGDRLVPCRGKELAERVALARGGLRARGVEATDRVVLLAPNSVRWVAADLAMLAEGAVVVPMYARQAPKELAAMMRDADPRLVVTADEALAAALQEHWPEAPVVTFDALSAGPAVDEPPRDRSSDDIVTLIYTSGTSGEPKGVMTSVGNVDFMLSTIEGKLAELLRDLARPARVFHYLPFCFAGSRFVLWTCLHRADEVRVSTDLGDLPREMKAASPDWYLNVPALLERVKQGVEKAIDERGEPAARVYGLVMAAWRRRRGGQARLVDRLLVRAARTLLFPRIRAQIGAQLKCLICGSAPLAEETQAWFELVGLPVYQVYGLTETTAITTMDRPFAAMPGTVGVPIDGVRLRLGDGDELQIQGENVFAGYFRREQATRDAFTDDGWFRSGDQAAIDAEGRVKIVGRVKNLLVPESGHNVAPEPLEERLRENVPGLEQAVVVGHGRAYLSAILTGDVNRTAAQSAIDALNWTLPHYRRIRGFHIAGEPFTVENGLLTANQKLRRRAIEEHHAAAIDRLYA